MEEQTDKVYVSLHENFVRQNIEYVDKQTGEMKTFNQATLPKGTMIDGCDMGGYEFSPLYINTSRFKGESWKDIPLLPNRAVWLQKSILDAEGNPVIDEDGRRCKETVKVMPEQIRDALTEARMAYVESHDTGDRGLGDKAREVNSISEALGKSDAPQPYKSVRG